MKTKKGRAEERKLECVEEETRLAVVEERKGKFDREGRLGERKRESKMDQNRILEGGLSKERMKTGVQRTRVEMIREREST